MINDDPERIIRGLEKKCFKGAREAIEKVIVIDKRRREMQQKLDANLAESKKFAAQIGGLMKQGLMSPPI